MTIIKFFKILYKEFNRHNCMQRASAMAFAMLFSLVPLIAVTFSLFASFAQINEIKDKIQAKILMHFLPNVGEKIGHLISSYIDQFATNIKAVSIIGVIGVAIISLALFNIVEDSFNHIWGVKEKRTIMQRYNAYAGILLGLPLLIGLSFYITSSFKIQLMSIDHSFMFIQKIYYVTLPFIFSCLAFVLSYKIIPNTNVRWSAAIVGGLIGGILWEIAKVAFGYYTTHFLYYNIVYGSLSTVPLFLAWLFITWLIVLIGIEISYCFQNCKELSGTCCEDHAVEAKQD